MLYSQISYYRSGKRHVALSYNHNKMIPGPISNKTRWQLHVFYNAKYLVKFFWLLSLSTMSSIVNQRPFKIYHIIQNSKIFWKHFKKRIQNRAGSDRRIQSTKLQFTIPTNFGCCRNPDLVLNEYSGDTHRFWEVCWVVFW